jgi:hypothetical protein
LAHACARGACDLGREVGTPKVAHSAYQPAKDARFALTLVEQLTACAETLRRLARHR